MRENSESASALRRFIDHEATGGLLLAVAAAIAIVFVNAGMAPFYSGLLDQRVILGIGPLGLDKSLHHFINDGLMAIFFLLVGLEIKREAREGNLAEPSKIVLPVAAALGGIVVPSGIYAFINWHESATLQGWAIPAATDIAFALGALALAGSRVPLSLKVFLLTLATFDDLAAIVIIALFYTADLSMLALGGAALCLAMLFSFNRLGIERLGPYIILGLVLWACVLKSGVHATLAGVALGLLIPMHRRGGSSPVHELEDWLHPYVKFAILPLFAFANAGLPLSDFSIAMLTQPVPFGIVAGLAVGKPVGILLATAAVVSLGWAKLPEDAGWRQVIGVACLGGIGFTMSLFIGSLAFADPALEAQVRAGVIAGSMISIVLGLAILFSAPAKSSASIHH